ncbi:hypothetical protein PYCC9005_001730 [Savitreella phatthalungensis]
MLKDEVVNLLSQPTWAQPDEDAVLIPYTYLLTNPGKDIRTLLIAALNRWVGLDDQRLLELQQIVEMLHTASLLVDDVEDASVLRRGKPAAHLKFGVGQTINAANYVYFLAFERIGRLGNNAVQAAALPELLNLHRGQGLELYWRDNGICPTEREYIAMVNDKTGGLLRLAIRVMLALVPNDRAHDIIVLANLVGTLFQIRDDYMNLASLQYARAKGFAEDVTEGKFSFPMVHACQQAGNDKATDRLREILRMRTGDVAIKREAVCILRTSGSLDYCRDQCDMLQKVCTEEIRRLGGNDALERILRKLAVLDPVDEVLQHYDVLV